MGASFYVGHKGNDFYDDNFGREKTSPGSSSGSSGGALLGYSIAAGIEAAASIYSTYLTNEANKEIADKTNQANKEINESNLAYEKEFATNQYQWQAADMEAAGINPLGANFGSLSFSNLDSNQQGYTRKGVDFMGSLTSLVSAYLQNKTSNKQIDENSKNANNQLKLQNEEFYHTKGVDNADIALKNKQFEEDKRLNDIDIKNKETELKYAAVDRLQDMAKSGVSYSDACDIAGLTIDKDTYEMWRKGAFSNNSRDVRADEYEASVGVPVEAMGSTTKDVTSGAAVAANTLKKTGVVKSGKTNYNYDSPDPNTDRTGYMYWLKRHGYTYEGAVMAYESATGNRIPREERTALKQAYDNWVVGK